MWAWRPRTSRPAALAALDRGRQRRQRNAELRVLLAGRDLLVGVGLDPRRHPQQDALAATGGEPLEAVDLVEGVDDQVADAGVERLQQLRLGLVVAVHVDALRVEAGAQRQCSSPPEATSQESPSSAKSR